MTPKKTEMRIKPTPKIFPFEAQNTLFIQVHRYQILVWGQALTSNNEKDEEIFRKKDFQKKEAFSAKNDIQGKECGGEIRTSKSRRKKK